MLEVVPVVLEGRFVRLEPLSLEHAVQLSEVSADPEVWRYLPSPLETVEQVRVWTETALRNTAGGEEMPFVTVDRETNRPVGSTRYMDIRRPHRGVEIGYSWLGTAWWRTALNSEAKYLMLRHAFETLGCMRVALKTDMLNLRSQRAIERLGAVREGILRKHMVVQDGRFRDTVYFSILDDEWPDIKTRIEQELYGEGR
jgi:RimJ/RimL family protein N-acetyltransferase